jgi:putative flippase GtrA
MGNDTGSAFERTAFVLDSALGALSEHGLPGRAVRFCRRRREQLLYLVVGGWNTLFAYGEWALLQYLLHDFVHYLAILVISWPLAVINAYVCYRHFVFRSRDRVWKELPRFSLVYLGTLVASLVALPFLLHTLPFDIYVIQAGFTFVVVILSYLSNKFFSFGGARRHAAAGSREGD